MKWYVQGSTMSVSCGLTVDKKGFIMTSVCTRRYVSNVPVAVCNKFLKSAVRPENNLS